MEKSIILNILIALFITTTASLVGGLLEKDETLGWAIVLGLVIAIIIFIFAYYIGNIDNRSKENKETLENMKKQFQKDLNIERRLSLLEGKNNRK